MAKDSSIFSLLQLLCNEESDENVAVRWKTSHQSVLDVTYREVKILSNKIKSLLCDNSVTSEFIGIQMEPGIAFPSTILGILKHGSAFVCLDHKKENQTWNENLCDSLGIQYILTNLNIEINNTHQKVIASIDFYNDIIYLIQCHCDCKNARRSVKKKNIAYACRTSGSTGVPKIVQVPHSSIIPNITHLRSKFGILSSDVIFQAAPSTFDPCVVEVFLALSSGASLLMVPASTKSSPILLASALSCEPRPTVIQATPSLITSLGLHRIQNLLLDKDSPLRILAFGGEACPNKSLLSKWKSPENKTSLFNVYGVTEVSCWSTCHQINLCDDTEERIPLGEPFPYTQLQVRDQRGNTLIKGEGELFISNGDRMCDVESQIVDSDGRKWCATGDIVELHSDGTMYFCNRRADSGTVKRWGHKVTLNSIETCAFTSGFVETCHAISSVTKSLHLVLFVVLNESTSDIKDVTKFIRKNLISVAQPEAIIQIPVLPLTSHGKIDKRKLKKIAKEWEHSEINKFLINKKKQFHHIKDEVRAAWHSVLGLNNDIEITDQSSFLASGGDSALAALLAADLLRCIGNTDDLSLLTTILENTFNDICCKVFDLQNTEPSPIIENSAVKRPCEDIIDVPVVDIAAGSSHIWRPAEPQNNYPKINFALSKGNSQHSHSDYYTKINSELALGLFWKCDMVKCVDASPLLLQYDNCSCLAVIGSHSGKVISVDIRSGEEKWALKLHDRIESSATVTPCGQFLCIGCYDGRLYCIEISSGILCWAFQSEAMIKGSAVFYKSSVMFGSYDQHIYCLNLKDGSLQWQNNLKAGAVLATPCLVQEILMTATLGGTITALCAISGTTLWTTTGNKPYFASPARIGLDCCVFGDVSGCITCINTNGAKIWSYETAGNLFSSFCVHVNEAGRQLILFGSSNGHVYCLNDSGTLIWASQLSGRVTSTLCVFPLQNDNVNHIVTAVSDPKNLTLLNLDTGKFIQTFDLPFQTFSSPIVINNFLIFGSRDNYLYCFQIK